jgi:hypothetical protein
MNAWLRQEDGVAGFLQRARKARGGQVIGAGLRYNPLLRAKGIELGHMAAAGIRVISNAAARILDQMAAAEAHRGGKGPVAVKLADAGRSNRLPICSVAHDVFSAALVLLLDEFV